MYHWQFFIRLVGTFILFEKEIMVVYSAYNIIECLVVLVPLNLNVKSYRSFVPVLLLLNFWSGSIATRYILYCLQIRSLPNLSFTRNMSTNLWTNWNRRPLQHKTGVISPWYYSNIIYKMLLKAATKICYWKLNQ